MYKTILSIYFACGMLLLSSAPAQAISIDVLPTTQEVNVNSLVSVDITISGLGDGVAPSLSGFDLDITYDPVMLATPVIDFGDQLDIMGMGSMQAISINSLTGIVSMFEMSLDDSNDLIDLQMPGFILATLTFETILQGTSTISVIVNDLVDANGEYLIADVSGAQINAVPIPGAIWLFYSGLACLVAVRSKRCSMSRST